MGETVRWVLLMACATLVAGRSAHHNGAFKELLDELEERLGDLKSADQFQCGTPAVTAEGNVTRRIVGGERAEPKQWPWMLRYIIEDYQACGATVLSQDWALTAAHCVYRDADRSYKRTSRSHGSSQVVRDPSEIFLVAGDYDRSTINGDEQTVGVARIVPHPDYSKGTHNNNDLALLKMATPLTLNENVRQVCVSSQDPPEDSYCVATGWGNTQDSHTSSNILRQVELPLMDQRTCENDIPNGLTENMFCAGQQSGGIDTCQGDSGGPLVCLVGDQWQQYGITSFGYGCAEPGLPGVYTRLSRYQDWIQETTADKADFM